MHHLTTNQAENVRQARKKIQKYNKKQNELYI